jgi:isopentenyl-diphosphate Delta-isomerase
MSDMLRRKAEHLDVVLTQNVRTGQSTGFEAVRFEHVALPELHLDEIDLGADFLGRRMNAPFLISSMTGGPEMAKTINENLARAAGQLRIAFAVGSQRVAVEGGGASGFGPQLRALMGDMPLLSNLGAAQLQRSDAADIARRIVDMIGADALIIHLNPLQEAVQHGGDRDWSGLMAKLEALVAVLPVPVVVKEVGSGISGRLAKRLSGAGVGIIDVAGAGGTSWAAVEAGRAPNERLRAVAETFRDWGIPTARALVDVRAACADACLIASGGIRTGLDAAKAIRLGADIVGQAAGVLAAALSGADAVLAHFEDRIAELRIACFCTGSRDLQALRHAPLLS